MMSHVPTRYLFGQQGGQFARRRTGCRFLTLVSALAVFLILVSAGSASGGVVHPSLEARLSAAHPDSLVSVLVVMTGEAIAGSARNPAGTTSGGSGMPDDSGSIAVPPARNAGMKSLLAALDRNHASLGDRHHAVVRYLQDTARESQQPLLAELDALGTRGLVAGYTPYWISNLVVVLARPEVVPLLAARDDVEVVGPNFRARLIEPVEMVGTAPSPLGPRSPLPGDLSPAGTESEDKNRGVPPGVIAIQADRVWKELGVTGAGTIVACLDTGVDGTHPALRDRWRGNHAPVEACWRDYVGDELPFDRNRHGTHVMGTMAGLGPDTADTVGVAWNAEWIASNALIVQSWPAVDNAIFDSFQWFADPDGDPATMDDVPDVVQNSWGVDPTEPGDYTWCDSRWWEVIDNCEAAGVVVTFSAGNSGPVSQSIISPADRADTETNAFSVGAVDATFNAWPYDIAGFSSRGPSRCPEMAIKPEVVAPGVMVYSCVPRGTVSYDFLSGTSMAGPHVAGIVALMREVNPDLDPDSVKRILMETARSYTGDSEDNTYGWGLVDAYAAVLAAAGDKGLLQGEVLALAEERPVPGAEVRLLELGRSWTTQEDGTFAGFVESGDYSVQVSHPDLESKLFPGVALAQGQVNQVTFRLADETGPRVEDLRLRRSIQAVGDSIPLWVSARDFAGVDGVELHYQLPDSPWTFQEMEPQDEGDYFGWLPVNGFRQEIRFYLEAADPGGRVGLLPEDGDVSPDRFFVQRAYMAEDGENGSGWVFGLPGDSEFGQWIRMAPFGSTYQGRVVEPYEDHSPGAGTQCFVTGKGKPNVEPDRADVDGGCVTLRSPILDLREAEDPTLSYWRWFAEDGREPSGTFRVMASSDGGATWTTLEVLTDTEPRWVPVDVYLPAYLEMTDQVTVAFVACDTGTNSIVEAAVDDIYLEGLPPFEPEPELPVTERPTAWPNPVLDTTSIRFRLSESAQVRLDLFDVRGRRVRVVHDGLLGPGDQSILWDGRDDHGRRLPSGLYFQRLSGEGFQRTGKVLVLQ